MVGLEDPAHPTQDRPARKSDLREENAMTALLTPRQIIARLDEVVVGQRAAKAVLANAFYYQEVRAKQLAANLPANHVYLKQNTLLLGPPGTGKTLLIDTIARLMGLPWTRVVAPDYLPLAGRGRPVADMLLGLVQASNGDPDRLSRGIVLIDEVDKIRRDGMPPDPGESLQQTLLALVQGQTVSLPFAGKVHSLDTTNILFVACGAFGDLEMALARSQEHGRMGIPSSQTTTPTSHPDGPLALATTGDLTAFGLIPEFLGRFPVRATLHPLKREDLLRILTHSTESPVARLRHLFHHHGIDLIVEEAALGAMVDQALQLNLGARGLTGVLDRIIGSTLLDLPELPAEKVCAVVIDECCVTQGKKPRQQKGESWIVPTLSLATPDKEEKPRDPEAEAIQREFPPGTLPHRPPRSRSMGSASHWANESDLGRWLKRPEEPHVTTLSEATILVEESTESERLKPLRSRALHWPLEFRNRHLLTVGKNGSGKTTRVILPLIASDLADPDRTLVILDAKGDLTAPVLALVEQLRGPNARVHYLNFEAPERSTGWNPLAGIRDRIDADEAANAVAQSLPTSREDSPFFRQACAKMMAAIITALTSHPHLLNPGQIYRLVEGGATALKKFATRYRLDIMKDGFLFDGSNGQTTMQELRNLLQAWGDDKVAACTAHGEFTFDRLQDEPCVVILAASEDGTLQPVINTFFQMLFRWITETTREQGGRLKRPLSLILDEFATAIGRVPKLDKRINTLRSRNVSLVAAVQTVTQISTTYREGATELLTGFNSTIYLTPLDLGDAERAARETGEMVVESIDTQDGSKTSVRHSPRPVLTTIEIASPTNHPVLGTPATVCLPQTPVFQAYLCPIFKHPEFARLFARPLASEYRPALRETALAWEAVRIEEGPDAGPLYPGLTDTTGWNTTQINDALQKVRDNRLGYNSAPAPARDLWKRLMERIDTPASRLTWAEELASTGFPIARLLPASQEAKTEDPRALIYYLLFLRLREEDEQRRAAERKKTEEEAVARRKEEARQRTRQREKDYLTDTKDWTSEQIRSRLEELKEKHLNWQGTFGHAQRWWLYYEANTTLREVLGLAEELAHRKATIGAFVATYQRPGIGTIADALEYLERTPTEAQGSTEPGGAMGPAREPGERGASAPMSGGSTS
jgi:ATP-dependent Clp protease ATP-binding subunit ClpX